MRGTSSLSASDFCLILDSCHKNKVKTLQIGSFKVSFSDDSSQQASWPSFVNPEVEAAASGQIPEKQFDPMRPNESAQLLEELRMAQLMTDDPVAFEQMMIDANLNQEANYETQVNSRFESDIQ